MNLTSNRIRQGGNIRADTVGSKKDGFRGFNSVIKDSGSFSVALL